MPRPSYATVALLSVSLNQALAKVSQEQHTRGSRSRSFQTPCWHSQSGPVLKGLTSLGLKLQQFSRVGLQGPACFPSHLALVLNVVGSAGDILMMRNVMSYPRATRFEDVGDGFVAYVPREHPLNKP